MTAGKSALHTMSDSSDIVFTIEVASLVVKAPAPE